MNLTRARHVLASPHLPWTTEVKQSLAQAYIDHTQALALLNTVLDDLEKEVATLRSQMAAVEDDLSQARADLRAACGVRR
jgi:phage shock protein A